jgi:glycosyltransferase involved in cell wall biosynthesis
MKVSIVVAYKDRRSQLLKTLDSIHHFGDPEIIVVDDGSSETIDDIPGITFIRIEPVDKEWINPCIPYNIGFNEAQGDIIIIQNPECIHCGDILNYSQELKPGRLLSFAAYSLDYHLSYDGFPLQELRDKIYSEPQRIQIAHHGWYNHSKYRPEALHFCNMVTRKDLEKIGGFDERYANGVGFDDNEILIRMRRSGMRIDIIDDPFVIHQKHERTDYANIWVQRMMNESLYRSTLKEDYIKPPNNKYYV